MKRLIGILAMTAVCVGFAPNVGNKQAAQAAPRDEIVINGSTTVLPIMQKAAEAYMADHSNVDIALSGGGSGNGIKALMDGLAHIAMSSRDMKDNETTAARAKGVEPYRVPMAVDALVPVVNPANPVDALSLTQLKDIFAGRITNWKDLGGDNAPIVVISRDTSSGTFETWDELVMKKERVMPAALLQASNGAVVQAVGNNKNALGYVGIGYLTPTIKALNLGNLTATPKSALSRQWPLARELYVFTNGKPQGALKPFIAYLLDPQKGQKAVLEAGFVPLH